MEVMPKATEKIRLKPRRPNKGDPAEERDGIERCRGGR